MEILQTRRLTLHTWTESDIDAALAIWSDPQVMALLDRRGAWKRPAAKERLRLEIARQEEFGFQYVGDAWFEPNGLDQPQYQLLNGDAHATLQARGHHVSAKRIARLMRHAHLVAKRRRCFCVTTRAQHAYPTAPNILNRQFAVARMPDPNRVWATDITYIPPHEGWLYLAIVLDLASRRVVGWAMRGTLDRRLTLDARHMAGRWHSMHETVDASKSTGPTTIRLSAP
jgi:hypothetical protein